LSEKDGDYLDAGWQREIRNFMLLTLDIPAVPLFKNSGEKNFIPNVPIYELLAKYDGATAQEKKDERKFYKIRKLPRILIIHMKR